MPCMCVCRVAGLPGAEVASLLSLRAKLQEEGLPLQQLLQAYTDAKAQVGWQGTFRAACAGSKRQCVCRRWVHAPLPQALDRIA